MSGDVGDPVECGVGEDSLELLMVGKRGGVVLLDVEVTLPSGGEHSGRVVDAGEDGPSCSELFGECSITAADVEDVFAGLRGEESDYFGCKGCDETAVGGVGLSIPGLTDPLTSRRGG